MADLVTESGFLTHSVAITDLRVGCTSRRRRGRSGWCCSETVQTSTCLCTGSRGRDVISASASSPATIRPVHVTVS